MRQLKNYPGYGITENGEVYRILLNGSTGKAIGTINSAVRIKDSNEMYHKVQIRDLMIETGFINPKIIKGNDMFLQLPNGYGANRKFYQVSEIASNYYVTIINGYVTSLFNINGNKLQEVGMHRNLFQIYICGERHLLTHEVLIGLVNRHHGLYDDRRQITFDKNGLQYNLEIDKYGFIYNMSMPVEPLAKPNLFGQCCFTINGVYVELDAATLVGSTLTYECSQYKYVATKRLQQAWANYNYPKMNSSNLIARHKMIPNDAVVSEVYANYSYYIREIDNKREVRLYNNVTGALIDQIVSDDGNIEYRIFGDFSLLNNAGEIIVSLGEIITGFKEPYRMAPQRNSL